jgi:hypothetical protein
VRALLEEAVRAVAVAKIEVLPRRAARGRAVLDGIPIDQDLDDAQVARKVAGVGVGLGQPRRRDRGVVLGRLRRAMPESSLQLQQGHGLLVVVGLAGDRGACSMARDAASGIGQGMPALRQSAGMRA